MNSTIIFVLIPAFIILVAGLIIAALQKRMKESWAGTVTDKKTGTATRKTDSGDYKETAYYIYIKTSEGMSKSVSVGKNLYDSFNIGDAIVKKSGSYNPEKA